MKFKKLLPILLLLGTLLGCTPNTPTSSEQSDTNSSISVSKPDVDYSADLAFKGVSIDREKIFQSADYNFRGVFIDMHVGAWFVAGDEYTLDVSPREGADVKYNFKFEDDGIFEIIEKEANGKTIYLLKGLKTGGTIFKIYGNDNLIYRNAINCRIPIRSAYTMFDYASKQDYWEGVYAKSTGFGDYRLVFNQDETTGMATSCVMSCIDSGVDYGSALFNIMPDTQKEIQMDALHAYEFKVHCSQPAGEIRPIIVRISLALDMIYVQDTMTLTDFFRPVSL